jgi:peptide-methionine (S)-S-oxide reductase
MDESLQEIATLGGGCFWCLEAVYQQLSGINQVVSGYAGGSTPNPTYKEVSTGQTGHAEVVQLTYNPAEISYRDILNVFFAIHDPTTPNRQGADIGPQYRSIILYHDNDQRQIAEEVIREIDIAEIWNAPLVTGLEQFSTFYPAEDYHQNYYRDNPQQPYCQVVIAPKVSKFRQKYFNMLKKG